MGLVNPVDSFSGSFPITIQNVDKTASLTYTLSN